MKLITAVLVFLFAINILFTTDSFAQNEKTETVDVYAVFWPVVPGTTIADGTFFLKQLKEGFGGFFTFGNANKSGYEIELSEKRLVEANKLIENKDYSNAKKSLDLNKLHRKQSVEFKRKAKEEKQDVAELTLKLVKSLEKQQQALIFLLTQVPENQRNGLEELVKDLTLQISEAK